MRGALFVLMLGLAVLCPQEQKKANSEPGAPACGPANEKFQVSKNKEEHHAAQPEPGKALMYVIENDADVENPWWRPTTRVGVDGKWIGATHGASYLYWPVEPGEHHLCVSWEGRGMLRKMAALHLTAEQGQVYYLQIINVYVPHFGTAASYDLRFEPLDSDKGQSQVASLPLSVSQPKK
jgi:hypothetical protein